MIGVLKLYLLKVLYSLELLDAMTDICEKHVNLPSFILAHSFKDLSPSRQGRNYGTEMLTSWRPGSRDNSCTS
jgi:hypothetical protein